MLTRKDYMANAGALHHAYYSELAAALGIKITNADLIERCKQALADGDEHLNSIPLQRWDVMAAGFRPNRSVLAERGEGWSLGTGVCCFKAAAKVAVAAL